MKRGNDGDGEKRIRELDYRGSSTGLRHQAEETLLRPNLIDTDRAEFFLVAHVEEGEGVDRASKGGEEILDAVGQGPALQVKRRPRGDGVSVDVKDLCECIDGARVCQLIGSDTAKRDAAVFGILDGDVHHLGAVTRRLETQGHLLEDELEGVDQTGCLKVCVFVCVLVGRCGGRGG